MNDFHPYWTRCFACVLPVLSLGLVACQRTPDPYTASLPYPPDLAVTVFVDTDWEDDRDPVTTRSYYIVLPDRMLHAAYGPGVTERLFPPPTAVVSPDAMRELWFIIDEHQLWEHEATHGQLQTAQNTTPIVDSVEEIVQIQEEMTQEEVTQREIIVYDVVETTASGTQPVVVTEMVATDEPAEQQVEEVDVDVADIEVETEPTPGIDEVTYRVQIIAYDNFYDYELPMKESVGTQKLIRKLAELRGWIARTPASASVTNENEEVVDVEQTESENDHNIETDHATDTETQTVIEAN